ncbi:MAG: rod shape-determining protein MreC [Candidatus Nomurabacteria bacterium]
MTYLSDKIKKRRQLLSLFLITASLLVLSFSWIQIRSNLSPVAEPIVITSNKFLRSIINFPYVVTNYFRSRDSYEVQKINLQNNIEELENKIALLQAENNSLKGIEIKINESGVKEAVKPNIILYPLAEDITRLYSTILLSKGFKDNIKENMIVYIRGRQPVCEIEELHPTTSLCRLLSASGNTIEGVTTDTKENITLTGDGGGNFLALLPKESNFIVGESVMYKTDQTMKLGTIVDIKKDPQDIFVRVYVRGSYNPLTSSLFYVDKE